MKTSSAILVLAFALAAPFVGAAATAPTTEELARNRQRWEALPQAERDRIKQSYRRYQQYRPEQVSAVQDNFRKFRDLAPERRRELSKKLQDLPPQERERVAQKLRELQNMGPDRRKMAIGFARLAHSLTPDQKRQLKQAGTPEERKQLLWKWLRDKVQQVYLQDKSPEEQNAFRTLPDDERKRLLKKTFRERVMRGPPGERGGPK